MEGKSEKEGIKFGGFKPVGLTFTNALFLVFLVLKLTHVIDWSWWWVTAPLWGPLALGLSILAVVFVFAFVFAGVSDVTGWRVEGEPEQEGEGE